MYGIQARVRFWPHLLCMMCFCKNMRTVSTCGCEAKFMQWDSSVQKNRIYFLSLIWSYSWALKCFIWSPKGDRFFKHAMWRSVRIAGSELLSCERPAYSIGPGLASAKWGLAGWGSYHSQADKSESCAWTVYAHIWLTPNTCSPLGSSEIWASARQRRLCDQPAIKTPGTESLVMFPGREHCSWPVTAHCWMC